MLWKTAAKSVMVDLSHCQLSFWFPAFWWLVVLLIVSQSWCACCCCCAHLDAELSKDAGIREIVIAFGFIHQQLFAIVHRKLCENSNSTECCSVFSILTTKRLGKNAPVVEALIDGLMAHTDPVPHSFLLFIDTDVAGELHAARRLRKTAIVGFHLLVSLNHVNDARLPEDLKVVEVPRKEGTHNPHNVGRTNGHGDFTAQGATGLVLLRLASEVWSAIKIDPSLNLSIDAIDWHQAVIVDVTNPAIVPVDLKRHTKSKQTRWPTGKTCNLRFQVQNFVDEASGPCAESCFIDATHTRGIVDFGVIAVKKKWRPQEAFHRGLFWKTAVECLQNKNPSHCRDSCRTSTPATSAAIRNGLALQLRPSRKSVNAWCSNCSANASTASLSMFETMMIDFQSECTRCLVLIVLIPKIVRSRN